MTKVILSVKAHDFFKGSAKYWFGENTRVLPMEQVEVLKEGWYSTYRDKEEGAFRAASKLIPEMGYTYATVYIDGRGRYSANADEFLRTVDEKIEKLAPEGWETVGFLLVRRGDRMPNKPEYIVVRRLGAQATVSSSYLRVSMTELEEVNLETAKALYETGVDLVIEGTKGWSTPSGGCGTDTGWLIIQDGDFDACATWRRYFSASTNAMFGSAGKSTYRFFSFKTLRG